MTKLIQNTMRRTIIACCSMVCATILIIGLALAGAHVYNIYVSKDKDFTTATEHKFNRCLAVAMSESRQSGKVIGIEEAKSICDSMQGQGK